MRIVPALLGALALAGAVAALTYRSPPGAAPQPEAAAPAPVDLGPEIAAFYRDRGFQPLWVSGSALRPEAHQLLRILERSPWLTRELLAAVRAAGDGDPHRLTRADLLLTQAYVDYFRHHLRPPRQREMRYIDAGLAPEEPSATQLLEEAAQAPSLAAHLQALERINPVYDGLRRGLAAYRSRWSALPQAALPAAPSPALLRRRLGLAAGAPDHEVAAVLREFQAVHGLGQSGRADPPTLAALNAGARHFEQLIEANLERARAIPPRPDGRYILVDTASARLWMVEDGRLTGSMRVVVGKPAMATPAMAGLVRYAVLNPYWNLPPDLVRERARSVVRRGPGALAAERLEILSDWTPQARPLSAAAVDWRGVAAGRRYVNLRQRPGPRNMMGAIKFMMPNDIGIYLHDTPFRELFARADRRLSSGCVRLQDAPRLAHWLFRGRVPHPSGAPEQRADLPEAVPVYIAYLTALPSRGSVVFASDAYRRDQALLAQLARVESARRP
ncbi:MAG TPA: L,D-transpeptidase family protein [Allosphingosinicella sp.]|nr:L,D-transpeptidase family protein [Allosphingosinicella sp.]